MTSSTGNVATEAILAKCSSRRLSYLAKHQRGPISAISEFYGEDGRKLGRVESGDNSSDLLTKPLDHEAHWKHCTKLGMGFPPDDPVGF